MNGHWASWGTGWGGLAEVHTFCTANRQPCRLAPGNWCFCCAGRTRETLASSTCSHQQSQTEALASPADWTGPFGHSRPTVFCLAGGMDGPNTLLRARSSREPLINSHLAPLKMAPLLTAWCDHRPTSWTKVVFVAIGDLFRTVVSCASSSAAPASHCAPS